MSLVVSVTVLVGEGGSVGEGEMNGLYGLQLQCAACLKREMACLRNESYFDVFKVSLLVIHRWFCYGMKCVFLAECACFLFA